MKLTSEFLFFLQKMDADSSYGGSDTAQDSTSHENPNTSDIQHEEPSDITIISHDNDKTNTTAYHSMKNTTHEEEPSSNHFYHKNEITLPVNYDEVDFQNSKLELKPPTPKLPHYMSTANLNINDTLENHSNLEQLNKTYNSNTRLNVDSPRSRKRSVSGVDNPAFQEDEKMDKPEKSDKPEKMDKSEKAEKPEKPETNGVPKSTFDEKKPYNNGDLNTSVSLGLKSPTKDSGEQMTEAVNLELVNLKPLGGVDIHENGATGTTIPVKKHTEVDIGEPYDEYFVPVNEHRKFMR